MSKQMLFQEQARTRLKRGVDTLAEAVATTPGPKGRNVAIDKNFGAPTVTHDGVSVAKEIELADPFENMGAQLLKQAAIRINTRDEIVSVASVSARDNEIGNLIADVMERVGDASLPMPDWMARSSSTKYAACKRSAGIIASVTTS